MNIPVSPRLRGSAQLIHRELEDYRSNLPLPDASWPPDVRVIINRLHEQLFEIGLEVQSLRQECGTLDHNISARFAHYVGMGIKAYILSHRLSLAKRLLLIDGLKVTRIALSVGYASPSAFTTTFRSHEGCSPSDYCLGDGEYTCCKP